MSRADANQIALRAVRSILEAAHDCTVPLGEHRATVTAELLPGTGWPEGGLEGLDPERDGAWPPTVELHYRWPGGEGHLRAVCYWWKTLNSYRHMVGISVRSPERSAEVVWITFGVPLQHAVDGQRASIGATLGFNRHADQESLATWSAWRAGIRTQADLAGLTRPAPTTVLLCEIDVPSGQVLPSASEAFTRLARVALLKLAVLGRDQPDTYQGDAPFLPPASQDGWGDDVLPGSDDPPAEKRAGIWPLPGGVRSYMDTLQALLGHIDEAAPTRDELYARLADQWGATGLASCKAHVNLLRYLGLVDEAEAGFSLTERGAR